MPGRRVRGASAPWRASSCRPWRRRSSRQTRSRPGRVGEDDGHLAAGEDASRGSGVPDVYADDLRDLVGVAVVVLVGRMVTSQMPLGQQQEARQPVVPCSCGP